MEHSSHLTSSLRPRGLRPRTCFYVSCAVLLATCTESKPAPPPLFESLPVSSTGIAFVNSLPEKADVNILNYLYYYNGGGVAAGDVNGDGLPDLYFTSNLGPNRLYINKGNYHFEDVTQQAGVADPDGWKSGVTMADVNGDGRLDIFVCGVTYLNMHGHNVLYINNGDGTFTDETEKYGLTFAGYSTQAVFFDYDGDGDLDMYLLNHSTHSERGVSAAPQREGHHARAGDRLYRNDGNHFTDVSERAHIYGGVEGYGLGVVVSDLNMDGCPDLFVANDFQENDFVYLNDCDGTFTESIANTLGHTSRSSMGVDAADFNNDLRPDIVVADMRPESEDVLNTSANDESFNVYDAKVKAGFYPQFARNTLQLNRGRGKFSEIGYLAGVYATDWSWAPLFADLDNDGYKDLLVTNGIFRRPNDMDYITYVSNSAVQASLANGVNEQNLVLLKKMPQIPIAKYAFHNNGDLTFTNVAAEWGLGDKGFSNGAVYVDLNNSGALDLVVNNINAPASIYRNRSRSINARHYLTVVLKGSGGNTYGIGAKVIIDQHGRKQMLEQMTTRGFQSSVDPRLHFGLDSSRVIDSLTVIWPNHAYQALTNVAGDTIITLSAVNAHDKYSYKAAGSRQPAAGRLFENLTDSIAIDYKHAENPFFDWNREPLLTERLSTEGPALAVADVNGDGLDDIYAGGAKWQPSKLFLQTRDGRFIESRQDAFLKDSVYEDVDAAFFDANGDGHPDLYVVSGGNEFAGNDEQLQDRLYLNDGRGNFTRSLDALPPFFENGSCVVPGDFNGDGRVDLFVGSRVVSRSYGLIPKSHLLQGDGKGHFTDVTLDKAKDLSDAGMVTSAAWLDYDGDGKLDLVVAGEWMPIRVFHQESGKLVDRTEDAGFAETGGWWNSVTAADLNGDGRKDLVLGNLGLNSYVKASPNEPARLYVGDFFGTGAVKQILTFFKNGASYPVAGRDELIRVMPDLASKYQTYASFGASKIEEILPKKELKQARILEAKDFASSVAINKGNGTFTISPLPVEAQFAPIYSVIAADFDGDGHADLLAGGNFYGVIPTLGRYDASSGLFLKGDGKGHFKSVDIESSNVQIDGQVRDMKLLRRAGGGWLVVVARNDDKLAILKPAILKPLLTDRTP
ncbi:MAG: VCBS repeat-containing protein [Gemmatimonadaceae bacterium]